MAPSAEFRRCDRHVPLCAEMAFRVFIRGKTVVAVGTAQLVVNGRFEECGIDGHGASFAVLIGHLNLFQVACETKLCLVTESFFSRNTNDRVCSMTIGTDRGSSPSFLVQHIDVDRAGLYLLVRMASPACEGRAGLILFPTLKYPFGMLVC
jgi:hypothetical protein